MASGSHQGYGFGSSDDNNNNNNGGGGGGGGTIHFDPSSIAAKEFNKTRMARPSAFPTATYSPPEESSFDEDVISTVEKTMKKYADNLMRFLEGISSRLSQLELYCYNLDKSIGEMRSDLVRDHGDSESKLKSLEKHIQEVQRSVQILRDKQELADTQKELAKLQLVSKESSSSGNTLQNEERSLPPTPEAKQNENPSDMHGQQLALALPHQVAPQPSLPARQMEHQQPHMVPQSSMPTQSMATQVQAYYLPAAPQMTNRPAPSQPSQIQYHPVPAQSQIQDPSMTAPQPAQSQVNQTSHYQSLPPYQQQWSQQVQQPFMQPQIRPSSQPIYSSYPPTQPSPAPNSMPMQVFGASSQPQPPTQNLKTNYEAQTVDGYVPSGPRSSLPHGNAYVIYDGEGGRIHHPPPPPHFQQSAYPPTSMGLQNPQRMPVANMVGPQSMRSHPYNELIEKLASMGYRGDHIVGVIQRLEESGQAVDFNAVLDRLNGHSSGGSQRGWSG